MGHELVHANAFKHLEDHPENDIHAIVTDPPYGVVEFETANLDKMREGEGGIWRIPPELDGNKRQPLPRFTVLTESDKEKLREFFRRFGEAAYRVLRPGGHLFIATTQLVMHEVAAQLDAAGLERRDVLVRETKTLRGGDRPKGAHEEYRMVSSMPRVYWEPWLLYRKPCPGRVQDCLEEWETGGLRRVSEDTPFSDLLTKGKTGKEEREITAKANTEGDSSHPNVKPQSLMRELCHASLPLKKGVILDPFMGSGSTIAAADALGYDSIGIELNDEYYKMAEAAIPELAKIRTPIESRDDIGSSSETGETLISDF